MSSAYWMTIEEIQRQREAGQPAERALHLITRAYENVSGVEVRAGYNLSIGYTNESLITRDLRRGGGPGRLSGNRGVDLYEVLGLHDTAPAPLVEEAFRVMRSVYLRVPMIERRRSLLLQVARRAHATLSDPSSRARYDETRQRSRGQPERHLWRLIRGVLEGVAGMLRGSTREKPAPQVTLFTRLVGYLDRADVAGGGAHSPPA